jgi:DNA polymerase-3 subunit beta
MITASVEAANVGSGKEAIPVDISGESLDIAFNIKYVIDALKSLSSSDAILHINRNNTPAIFTPIGGETQKLVLLMPIQIRD